MSLAKRFVSTISLLALVFSAVHANVHLPAILGDHMVLQQNATVRIWGWAIPLEVIQVRPSWTGTVYRDTTASNASWSVNITTPRAGGPYRLSISGYNAVEFEDIYLGEVWLASGQSNMAWSAAGGIQDAENEISRANHPEIRFFSVPQLASEAPQENCQGEWLVCSPETMQNFSAVAYFFGETLHEQLRQPVGLINASWGATPAETWVSPQCLVDHPELCERAHQVPDNIWGPTDAGVAFNGMIAPLTKFRLAGVIWYQGEENTNNPGQYKDTFQTLIRDWRSTWSQNLPFYYVQIAPYDYGSYPSGVWIRDAQRQVLSTPGTGMVVTSDIADPGNIHFPNKRPVGERLARMALNRRYGSGSQEDSGPLYQRVEIEGRKIRVFFTHTQGGLLSKFKQLTSFELAGEDGIFYPAQAMIDGNTVLIRTSKVSAPRFVRMEWNNQAEAQLFNGQGLPASCFRTDDLPLP